MVLLKRPELTVHEESPARAKVPSSQTSHDIPINVLPAVHVEQYDEPESFSGAPLVHVAHLSAFALSVKVPLPQSPHSAFAVEVHFVTMYLPGMHSVHKAANDWPASLWYVVPVST